MSGHLRALALGLVGIVLGVGAVIALREATLSTHEAVDPSSHSVLELEARRHRGEAGQTLDEMVEAILLLCRLEVNSDLVGPAEREDEASPDVDLDDEPDDGPDDDPDDDPDDGRYRAVFQPALDQTNRRQVRGCLEDWTLDQVRVDVLAIRTG